MTVTESQARSYASSQTPTGPRFAACLAIASLSLSACRDVSETRIDFSAQQAVLDVDIDSGDVVVGTGATVRMQTHAYAGYTVRAAGLVRDGELEPIVDSGEITVEGRFALDLSATLDLPQGSFAGPVDSLEYELETVIGAFDPFLLDQTITVPLGIPAQATLRFPIIGLPGVDLVLEYATGQFLPTFGGVCLRREGDVVQYTGSIVIEPDIRHIVSIEIAVPFSEPQVIGPVGVEMDFPPLVSHPLDLGTYSVSSGALVEGVFPCGEVDPAEPVVSTSMSPTDDGGGSGESGSDESGGSSSG